MTVLNHPIAERDSAARVLRVRWMLRLRWLAAIAFALVPVVFTAAASAAAQIAQANDGVTAFLIAGGAGLSAAVGVVVMKFSPPRFVAYGVRAPRGGRAVWWCLPLLLTIAIACVSQGIRVSGSTAVAYAVLAVAVAVNEEVWFRGIILAILRRGRGTVRVAVVGSSALFGVLHLANLAGGEDPAAAVLQLVFAVLFGLVAAEVTVLTGSLWPAIAWHAAWDFTNYLGGNATDANALAGLAIAGAVVLAYAIVLWRRVA